MKKKSCVITIVATGLGIYLLSVFFENFGHVKEWGMGVDSVDWLPDEASEITYVSSYLFKVAEFDIEQDLFLQWCDLIGKPLEIVTEGQRAGMHRSNLFLERCGAIESSPVNESSSPEEWLGWYGKSFSPGDLFYQIRQKNNGGYSIGYDVKTGQGYYSYFHN